MSGCGSYYTDKRFPCVIDNSIVKSDWLYRVKGRRFIVNDTTAHAFEAYADYQKDDSGALIARIAPEG